MASAFAWRRWPCAAAAPALARAACRLRVLAHQPPPRRLLSRLAGPAPPPPAQCRMFASRARRPPAAATDVQRLRESKSQQQVLQLVEQQVGQLRPTQLAAALCRLVLLADRRGGAAQVEALADAPAVRALLERAHEALGGSEAGEKKVLPVELAQIAHAVAKMALAGPLAERLWSALEARTLQCVGSLGCSEVAVLAWAFMRAPARAEETIEALARQAEWRAHQFSPSELCRVVYACAKAGTAASPLFAAAAAELARSDGAALGQCGAQDLANLAWAYATAGVPAPALFDAIVSRVACAATLLSTFTEQGLSNLAWAFARQQPAAPCTRALLGALAGEAEARVQTFTPQGLATLCWAYTTAGVAAPALLQAVGGRALLEIEHFRPQDLSVTATAFAKAGVLAYPHWRPGVSEPPAELVALFEGIARRAEACAGGFEGQAMANTAAAFAHAGLRAPALFAAFERRAAQTMGSLGARERGQLAWAYAKCAQPAPSLFEAVGARACAEASQLSLLALSTTAWALAYAHIVLGEAAADGAGGACGAGCSSESILGLAEQYLRNASQLSQEQADKQRESIFGINYALLACHVSRAPPADGARLLRLRARVAELAAACGSDAPIESTSQRQLSTRLRAAGWAHAQEVSLEDGLLKVDMACTHTRVCVEFDGPSHYLRTVGAGGSSWSHDGSTQLKTRLLEALGWRVLRVSWKAWQLDQDAQVERLVETIRRHSPHRADAGPPQPPGRAPISTPAKAAKARVARAKRAAALNDADWWGQC
jgi:hypothetical protein